MRPPRPSALATGRGRLLVGGVLVAVLFAVIYAASGRHPGGPVMTDPSLAVGPPTAAPMTAFETPTSGPAPTASESPSTTQPSRQPSPTAGGHAAWRAPRLVEPLVWVPSAKQRVFKAPADRDVLVQWPDTPLDVAGGFQIAGGRNVVSRGGVVRFSQRYPVPGEPHKSQNRCFYLTGNGKPQAPRTVHVEGLHCAGSYIWEGINVDSKAEGATLTVQFRDIRVDQVNVTLPGGLGKHEGGDALQTWNGPHRLRIDGFTAKNLHYQGFFLQPFQFGDARLALWEFNRVQLEGADAGHGYLLWLAGSRSPGDDNFVPLSLRGVHVVPSAADTRANTLWDSKIWPEVKTSAPPTDFVRAEGGR